MWGVNKRFFIEEIVWKKLVWFLFLGLKELCEEREIKVFVIIKVIVWWEVVIVEEVVVCGVVYVVFDKSLNNCCCKFYYEYLSCDVMCMCCSGGVDGIRLKVLFFLLILVFIFWFYDFC